MSITMYGHSPRLRHALSLLHQRSDISDVALEIGYSSHSHFGVTPSDYRESR